MDKSEFYKSWYTKEWNTELNEFGFPPPPILWLAEPITTQEQWDQFLELEPSVEDFLKTCPEASAHANVPFVRPHTYSRAEAYPDVKDQLDGVYKALLAIKASGIDLGSDAHAYLDSITAVKTEFPKTHAVPEAPDPTKFSD